MPKFIVLFRATNFLFDFDGEVMEHAGYTSAVVKASEAREAIRCASDLVLVRINSTPDVSHLPNEEVHLEVVRVEQASKFRRVRAYNLVVFEPDDAEAEREALALAEEAVGAARRITVH